ncbi:TolB amino-terminal domain-containing protein [Bosea lathyri]|uniref:TolB amino-terminal domain-containing protein n=2 Tax=Bosea lathyri TaxID=1036778 RepID=A0A1H6BGV5_9HYPH|nr:TolB amino-terminal domain-containing protein [Bosea lathyri]
MEQERQGGSQPGVPAALPFCAERIREQLHRILSSADFAMPPRIHAFLSYVVEEALAGRADRIKAYSIAVAVFGRPTDFDTLNDPAVRIEAGRLRRGLERYYLLQGSNDPVLIDIPKGGYVPHFRSRASEGDAPVVPIAAASSPKASSRRFPWEWHSNVWLQGCLAVIVVSIMAILSVLSERTIPARDTVASRPYVLVKTFENLSGSPHATALAAGLSDEILAALSAKGGLAIFRSDSAHGGAKNADAHPPRQAKQYVLDGAIREARDKLRIASRLVQAQTGEIVWSNVYEADLQAGIDHEAQVATKISGSVSQAIHSAEQGHHPPR